MLKRFTLSLDDKLVERIDKEKKKSPFTTRTAFLTNLIDAALQRIEGRK